MFTFFSVVPELREIIYKLLQRIVKSIKKEKWERKLVQVRTAADLDYYACSNIFKKCIYT